MKKLLLRPIPMVGRQWINPLIYESLRKALLQHRRGG